MTPRWNIDGTDFVVYAATADAAREVFRASPACLALNGHAKGHFRVSAAGTLEGEQVVVTDGRYR